MFLFRNLVPSIKPHEAQAKLRGGESLFLLDVREHHEVGRASVEGAVNIPMGEVPNQLGRIPKDREVAVLCHHGARSAQVVAYLLRQGFRTVLNVEGGIDLWSTDVDPTIPRY